MTREHWLSSAISLIRPFFKEATGEDLPDKLRVSCGWPSKGGLSTARPVFSQTFPPEASVGGNVEIFISPKLSSPVKDDGQGVLPSLLHECVHAVLGPDHDERFKSLSKALGFVGRSLHPPAVNDATKAILERMAGVLGDYPHSRVEPPAKEATETTKTSNRQRKISCPRVDLHTSGEEYILRGSAKVIAMGLPECPLCGSELVPETSDASPEDAPVDPYRDPSGPCEL